MQKLTTVFRQYAVWLQTVILSLIVMVLVFSSNTTPQKAPDNYLQMLGNLALPYLISGDRAGLQQSLDLIVQNSPVLEARILNTENRPLMQVINRSVSEESRNLSAEFTRELVLEQALLGTLSISVAPQQTRSSMGLIFLSLLALAIGAGQLLIRNNTAVIVPQEKLPGKTARKRFLIAISLGPIIEQLKQGGSTKKQLELLVTMVRQLAPSYGLEYVTTGDETVFLQSNSDDKLSLRQAVVFAWNACQSLGAERGLFLRGCICPVDLSDDIMLGNLAMIAGDEFEICADLQTGCAAGTISLNQDLATTLPKEWDVAWDNNKQRCVISELPISVCNLWRRQLSNLAGK